MKKQITLLSLVFYALIITSCDNEPINAEGPIVNQERVLNDYTSIVLDLPAKVYITDDPGETFRIRTHENLLPVIDTYVIGNRLRITSDHSMRKVKTLDVFVSANDYEKLSINGSGSITTERCISVDRLSVEINGSGVITICGNADELNTEITGSGKIAAYGLESIMTTVKVSGSGEVQTSVSEALDVDISGSGTVRYIGNPEITSKITGSGAVVKKH